MSLRYCYPGRFLFMSSMSNDSQSRDRSIDNIGNNNDGWTECNNNKDIAMKYVPLRAVVPYLARQMKIFGELRKNSDENNGVSRFNTLVFAFVTNKRKIREKGKNKRKIREMDQKTLFLCYFLKENQYDLEHGQEKNLETTFCYFPAI